MRNIRSTARCSLFALILIAAGCAGYWGRRSIEQPTAVETRAPVWIWSGGEVMKWHAVVITQDWVSGIPYEMSVHCYNCWRNIPRARVDSMKVGYRTLAENVTEVVGASAVELLVEVAVCTVLGIRGEC
jgi:hypothetical protein